MKYLIVLALAAGTQLFAQKNDTLLILPGNQQLQTNLLRDYSASYDLVTVNNGEEKKIGSLEDHFFIRAKGKQALRVCKITFGANNILDSGLCELKGLVPVYHRSAQTKKDLNLLFSGVNITGDVISKNEGSSKKETINYAAPYPLFDSYYEDILAKVLDINNGVIFKFPEYIYEKGGTVWSAGEILKGEKSGERMVKFYELNARHEVVRTTTFMVNEQTRDIIQREYQTATGRILMKKKPA